MLKMSSGHSCLRCDDSCRISYRKLDEVTVLDVLPSDVKLVYRKLPLCDVELDVLDVRVQNSAGSSVMWKE